MLQLEITNAGFRKIEKLLPLQLGNVKLSNIQVLNAILYVAEHGCKWRRLPKKFSNWHSIYSRANRWAKNGVLDRVFIALQENNSIYFKLDHVSLDSTIVKVHPDGTGALKKTIQNLSGKSYGGWSTKIHLVAADEKTAVVFSLSQGQVGDAAEGRSPLKRLENKGLEGVSINMDRAYEGGETRQLVFDLGMTAGGSTQVESLIHLGIR